MPLSLGLDDQVIEVNTVVRETSNLGKRHDGHDAGFPAGLDVLAPGCGARCLVCLHVVFPFLRVHEHALPSGRTVSGEVARSILQP